MVQAESIGELNGFRLSDVDAGVLLYCEQPFEVLYELDGVIHRHYPDVAIKFEGQDQDEVWEIKPRSDFLEPATSARTALMQAALAAYGYNYRTIANEDLKSEPRLSNARTVLTFGNCPIDARTREQMRVLMNGRRIYWASVLNGDLGANGRSVLCRLVLEGAVKFDFERKLVPCSEFLWGSSKRWIP
jgi:hypothetical protein